MSPPTQFKDSHPPGPATAAGPTSGPQRGVRFEVQVGPQGLHAFAFTDGSVPLSAVHLQLCRKLRDQAPYRIGPIHICRLGAGVMSVDARRLHRYSGHVPDRLFPRPWAGVVRVFLVDDQGSVCGALQEVLDAAEDVCVIGQASSVHEATRHVLELRPHVMILATRLPDGSGVTVSRDVRAVDPAVHALMLAGPQDRDGLGALLAAILAGADGYLLEHVDSLALVTAVNQVAAGRSLIDPTARGRLLDGIRRPEGGSHVPGCLTAQERQLFIQLAEGLSDRQIAQRACLPESTARMHVESLLERLGLAGRSVAGLLADELLGSHGEADPEVEGRVDSTGCWKASLRS